LARKSDIRLRRSNVANAVPGGADLNEGELAINTADGALYFKKSDGTIITGHDDTIMHIDSTNSRVGIGTTSPTAALHISGTSAEQIKLERTNHDTFRIGLQSAVGLGFHNVTDSRTEMIISGDGNVGIGTTSPSNKLTVDGDIRIRDSIASLYLQDTDGTSQVTEIKQSAGFTTISSRNNTSNGATLFTGYNGTATTEYARFDSSGNLLVGKTSANIGTVGHQLLSDSGGDYAAHTSNGTRALLLNRLTSDGEILDFRKDGTSVGSIGTVGADVTIGTGDTGLRFRDEFDAIQPHNITTNGTVNGVISLGKIGAAFKDLHLSGVANAAGFQSNQATNGFGYVNFGDTDDANIGQIGYDHTNNYMRFQVNNTEKMRIDSSGNLLVGTTDSSLYNNTTGVGVAIHDNHIQVARSSGVPLYLNRQTSDGTIAEFRKDGSQVGSIGTRAGDLSIGTNDTGINFWDASNNIIPENPSTGAARDDAINLGASGVRFKDLHLSGSAFIDTQTRLGSGSATTPAYSFSADSDSGIFRATTNALGFTTGGTERARIDSSGNVGIGTTSPKSLLNVTGTGADGGILTLENNSTSLVTDRKVGQIHFYSNDGSTNGAGVKADIKAIAENSIGSEIGLAFGTSGTGSATAVEAMRIDSAGNVGIGTNNPQTKLHVEGITRITESNNTAFYGGDYVRVFGNQYYNFRNTGGSNIARIHMSGSSFFNGGNVGIGTAAPQQQLTIGTLETSSIITHGTVGIKTASDNKAINIQENSGSEGWGFGVDSSGNLNFYDSASTDPSVTFKDNGGVGIGTSSPNSVLHVSHATAPTFRLSRTGTGQVWVQSIDSSGRFQLAEAASEGGTQNTRLQVDDTGEITFNAAYTFPTTIGSAGQVLKVPTSGTSLIWGNASGGGGGSSIEDNDGDTKIQVEETADEDIIRFDIAGTQKMFLSSTQLGITGDLAVSGNLNIVGDINSTSVTNLDVTDKTITVANNAGSAANANGAGIVVDTGGTNPSLTYTSANDEWNFNKNLVVGGKETTSSFPLMVKSNTSHQAFHIEENSGTESYQIGVDAAGDLNFYNSGGTTPMLKLNDGNNFILGHTSYTAQSSTNIGGNTDRFMAVTSNTAGQTVGYHLGVQDGSRNSRVKLFMTDDATEANRAFGIHQTWSSGGSMPFVINMGSNERMRITSGGIALFGKTVADNTTNGIRIDGTNDFVSIVRDGDLPLLLNRKTSDGTLLELRKDSATVGSIGSRASAVSYMVLDPRSASNGGVGIGTTSQAIVPTDYSGANVNGTKDLGNASYQWKDLHLSNNIKAHGDSSPTLDLKDTTNNCNLLAYAQNSTANIGTYSNHPLIFDTNSSERMRIDSSGNVGIGTSSPSKKFEVHDNGKSFKVGEKSGYAVSYGPIIETNSDAIVMPTTVWVNNSNVRLYKTGTSARLHGDGGIEFGVYNGSAAIEAMRIKNDGKVGIGTTAPATKFHVANGSDTSDAVRISGGHASRYLAVKTFESNSLVGAGIILNASSSGGAFKFQTTSTDRMIINHLGDVGIGTTSPTRKLQVNGTGNTAVAITSPNTAYVQLALGDTDDDNYAQIILDNSSNKLQIQNGGGGVVGNRGITLDSSEKVGIGTSSPAQPLHVKFSGDSGVKIESDTSHSSLFIDSDTGYGQYIRFSEAGSNKYWINGDISGRLLFRPGASGVEANLITFDSTGRVGIGKTTVKAKLQVEEYGIDTTTSSTSATTQVAIHTFPIADFRSARFTIQITNTTDSTYHSTEILAIHDGTTANITEFGEVHTGSSVEATFDADISSSNFRLLATPTSINSMTFKVVCHSLTV